jgi:hypothetical protein
MPGMGTRRSAHAVLARQRRAHCHANTHDCALLARHALLLLSTVVAVAVLSQQQQAALESKRAEKGCGRAPFQCARRCCMRCAHRGKPSGACQARLEEAFWHAARQSRSHMPDCPIRQAPAVTVRTSSAHCRRSTHAAQIKACEMPVVQPPSTQLRFPQVDEDLHVSATRSTVGASGMSAPVAAACEAMRPWCVSSLE